MQLSETSCKKASIIGVCFISYLKPAPTVTPSPLINGKMSKVFQAAATRLLHVALNVLKTVF